MPRVREYVENLPLHHGPGVRGEPLWRLMDQAAREFLMRLKGAEAEVVSHDHACHEQRGVCADTEPLVKE